MRIVSLRTRVEALAFWLGVSVAALERRLATSHSGSELHGDRDAQRCGAKPRAGRERPESSPTQHAAHAPDDTHVWHAGRSVRTL